MRSYSSCPKCIFVVASAVLLGGCPGVVPGSREYQPLPQWEARFFADARRDIFPNDVRHGGSQFAQTLVVWTGIITKIEYLQDDSSRVARITAEHHYFDWIEDFGIQREHFFLSPRGEGNFAVAWRADTGANRKFLEKFAVGDLLVAYGCPSTVRGEIVALYPTENIRAVKREWYRTDILDYGRPGDPVTHMKVAF